MSLEDEIQSWCIEAAVNRPVKHKLSRARCRKIARRLAPLVQACAYNAPLRSCQSGEPSTPGGPCALHCLEHYQERHPRRIPPQSLLSLATDIWLWIQKRAEAPNPFPRPRDTAVTGGRG